MKFYPNLLSPIQLGPLVLKSRMISGNSLPHFLQGPESYPPESVINHVVSCAKNGAAVVTFADWTNPGQRTAFNEDGKRFPMYDLSDPSVENYLCQLADQVHYYGSYISLAIMPFTAPDPMYDVYDVPAVDFTATSTSFRDNKTDYDVGVMTRLGQAGKQLTPEMIADIIETQARQMKRYQGFGFDMCTLHFAYRATLFSRFLSPITNKRTDGYGGDIQGRARFLLELCGRIKALCGKDFPIEVQLSAQEPGGTTIDETIQLARLAEGLVDVFQFRASDANTNHPTGYNSRPHQYATLADCAAVKASGTRILCEPMGGFQDLDDMEAALAQGKADLIGGARAFFVDPDYYQKAREGRNEDVLPCVRCNKCHVPSLTGPWLSFCTVSPELGLAHKLDKLTVPAGAAKRVAVVGGGPTGMRAALYLAQRGHAVTLYEKTAALGGQLCLMDDMSFKWPLVRYREYLKTQLAKSAVRVQLGVDATAELLRPLGYEVVVAALGAQPKLPPIPGAARCRTVFETLGHEKELGRRCVVIGGSETGTEVGMYLAEAGHDVVILTRQDGLATDATPIHYREIMQESYARLPSFDYIPNAAATLVGEGFVEYQTGGQTQRLACDSVVALGGMEPLQAQAMTLYDAADAFYMAGDCRRVGNLHTCNRDAYSITHSF